MRLEKPKFMDSNFFHDDLFEWKLDEEAPEELKKEFKEYMEKLEEQEEEN